MLFPESYLLNLGGVIEVLYMSILDDYMSHIISGYKKYFVVSDGKINKLAKLVEMDILCRIIECNRIIQIEYWMYGFNLMEMVIYCY